jgi:hypothetical protein
MPKNKKPRRNRREQKLYGRARRDVRVSMQDYLDELARAGRGTSAEAREGEARTGAVYGALQSQLAPLSAQYQGQAQGIMADLQSRLGQAGQGVGTGTGEAATGLLGAIGQTGLSDIGSQQARNLGYLTSVATQGGVESTQRQAGIGRAEREQLADLRQRRTQAFAQAPQLTRARLDELRETASRNRLAAMKLALDRQAQNFQQGMASKELEGTQALWQLIMDYYKNRGP